MPDSALEPSPIPGLRWRHEVGHRSSGLRVLWAVWRPSQPNTGAAGEMRYQVCRACRTGKVWNIVVFEPYERRGIAAAMLARARLDGPGYRWCTATQQEPGFWVKIAERVGCGYQPGTGCDHIERRAY